jgi:hypothetical protein
VRAVVYFLVLYQDFPVLFQVFLVWYYSTLVLHCNSLFMSVMVSPKDMVVSGFEHRGTYFLFIRRFGNLSVA